VQGDRPEVLAWWNKEQQHASGNQRGETAVAINDLGDKQPAQTQQ